MAMTIVQLQAFIDSKPDTRAIINEIADYLQANPGGGGNTIYTANDALASDRIVYLNGKFLSFDQDSELMLSLDPTVNNEVVSIKAYNITDDDNEARFRGNTTDTEAEVSILARFNGGVKDAEIELFADATTSTIEHTADINVMNGILQVAGDNFQITTPKTPASAADAGTIGQIAWDSDFVYVCVATNTWKRTAIATW